MEAEEMKRYTVPDIDGNFAWAFKLMLDGVLVRRRFWADNLCVTIVPPADEEYGPRFTWFRDGEFCTEGFNNSDLLATDWELL